MYFCVTQTRPGSYHKYIVPPWVLAGAGVWAAALYYFARHVVQTEGIPASTWERADKPLLPTWTKVGCAMAALNVYAHLFIPVS